MNKEERELMLNIAKRLGEIEKDIALLRKTPAVLNEPVKSSIKSEKANKFFNNETSKINGTKIKFINEKVDDKTIQEVQNGEKLLRKAIQEFCQEFGIEEFEFRYNSKEIL